MQLLPVTGRSAFGWCHASSAQNRPLVHEGESAGKREERERERKGERERRTLVGSTKEKQGERGTHTVNAVPP